MQWRDQVDLSQYRTAAAPYGGPIGNFLSKTGNMILNLKSVRTLE